eukprot:10598861-Heterocapsa_arctica.AAC.1
MEEIPRQRREPSLKAGAVRGASTTCSNRRSRTPWGRTSTWATTSAPTRPTRRTTSPATRSIHPIK